MVSDLVGTTEEFLTFMSGASALWTVAYTPCAVRVLIVEDGKERSRKPFVMGFEAEHYEVRVAGTGEEGFSS